MYAQDYDEMFPRSSGYVAPATIIAVQGEWYITLQPYIKNNQIFNCPSQPYTAFYSGGTSSTALGYGVGYSRNLDFGSNPAAPGPAMAMIKEPAAIVYLTDGANNYCRLPCPGTTVTCGWTNYAWAWNRHNDGANYVFADGHAKWGNVNGATGRATQDFRFHFTFHP